MWCVLIYMLKLGALDKVQIVNDSKTILLFHFSYLYSRVSSLLSCCSSNALSAVRRSLSRCSIRIALSSSPSPLEALRPVSSPSGFLCPEGSTREDTFWIWTKNTFDLVTLKTRSTNNNVGRSEFVKVLFCYFLNIPHSKDNQCLHIVVD
jgi:hypothetical protein